jgi:hypothetical protein
MDEILRALPKHARLVPAHARASGAGGRASAAAAFTGRLGMQGILGLSVRTHAPAREAEGRWGG